MKLLHPKVASSSYQTTCQPHCYHLHLYLNCICICIYSWIWISICICGKACLANPCTLRQHLQAINQLVTLHVIIWHQTWLFTEMHATTLHYIAQQCKLLHYITFRRTILCCIAYQCSALHFDALLHCISTMKCTEVQPAEYFHLILQSASIPSFRISLLCKLDWILCLIYLLTKSYIWLDHDDVWSRSPDERDKKDGEWKLFWYYLKMNIGLGLR